MHPKVGQVILNRNPPASFLTATTLIYAIETIVAAGNRLALQLIPIKWDNEPWMPGVGGMGSSPYKKTLWGFNLQASVFFCRRINSGEVASESNIWTPSPSKMSSPWTYLEASRASKFLSKFLEQKRDEKGLLYMGLPIDRRSATSAEFKHRLTADGSLVDLPPRRG